MHHHTTIVLLGLVVCSLASLQAADLPDDYRLPPAPGAFVSPAKVSGSRSESFSEQQPLVLTSYFYWYDDETKSHIVDGDGSDALTDHPPTLTGMSYRNPQWHQRQLEDMVQAGIDVALPVYWGTPGAPQSWSDVGLPPMVRARQSARHCGQAVPPRSACSTTPALCSTTRSTRTSICGPQRDNDGFMGPFATSFR